MTTPTVISPADPDLRTNCGQLKFGDEGSCVAKLQRLLNARGAQLFDNGIFGEHTLDEILQFQRARGLQVTGIVADHTKAALYDFPAYDVDFDLRTDCVDLDQGAQGPCVVALQHLLQQYGASFQATGTYGSRTTEAVLQFQHDHELRETNGTTHSLTKQALYDHLTDGAPSGQNTKVSCSGSECDVYLGRSFTAIIAEAFDKRKILRELVPQYVSEIACLSLKTTGITVICKTIVKLAADAVILQLLQARDNHKCIRVGFQSTAEGARPAGLTPADDAHCPS